MDLNPRSLRSCWFESRPPHHPLQTTNSGVRSSPAFRDFLPETDDNLNEVALAGDRLIVSYLVDAKTEVKRFRILAVQFRIGAGLLDDEDVHAQPQQRVEFDGGEAIQPPHVDVIDSGGCQ